MPDEFKHLNKDDLFLLMESYRNMIQMHSTLVEQQKQIMDLQHDIIKKQDSISMKQTQSCGQLEKVVDRIEESASNLGKINESVTTGLTDVNTNIGNNKLEFTKQHSGINTKIYVSMGAMATIVISLVALSIGLLDKYDLLQEIYEMVKDLTTYFNPVGK